MAKITADRVLETSVTTGNGPYTLSGAVIGFRSLASVSSSLDTFNYFCEDVAANGAPAGDWEVGIGTLNSDGSIARTHINSSSNNNLAVVWGAGTRRFGLTVSAADYSTLTTLAEVDIYMAPVVDAVMGSTFDLMGIYQLST